MNAVARPPFPAFRSVAAELRHQEECWWARLTNLKRKLEHGSVIPKAELEAMQVEARRQLAGIHASMAEKGIAAQ